MSEIKKLIERLCPDEVEYKKLGELGTFYGGLTGKSKKDFGNGNAKFITYMNVYSNPALDLSVTDTVQIAEGEKQNKVQYKDILFTGSSETPEESGMTSVITKEIQEDFYLNSFCFGLRLFNPDLFNADFLKHYFRSHEARKAIARTASGVTRFNVSKAKLANFEIPVPPIEVQSKIVEYLDNFTELEAELEARKKQYEYYRNQLLTFDKDKGARFDVKWCTMKDICKLQRGKVYSKKYIEENKGNFPVYSSQTADNGELGRINTYDFEGDYITWTTDGAYAGTVFRRKGKFSITNVCGLISITDKSVKSDYLYYWLSINAKNYVYSGMGNPKLMSNQVEEIKVAVPPLSEQQRIVSILDRFEALTTDLQSGLPAEIEARRKQYEYYREQLLTFKRKTA